MLPEHRLVGEVFDLAHPHPLRRIGGHQARRSVTLFEVFVDNGRVENHQLAVFQVRDLAERMLCEHLGRLLPKISGAQIFDPIGEMFFLEHDLGLGGMRRAQRGPRIITFGGVENDHDAPRSAQFESLKFNIANLDSTSYVFNDAAPARTIFATYGSRRSA